MAYTTEQYEEHFNPRLYAELYVSNAEYDYKSKVEEFYHKIFHEKRIPGTTQVDIGSGATFRGVISSSAYFTEIYTSDLLASAREESEKWLRGDPQALDFSWAFKLVAKFEDQSDYKKLEERVRKAVKGVLPCNLLLPNPLHPMKKTFDVVTSSYCIDCFDDKDEYFSAVRNIASLIKPGGHIALVSATNCTKYTVGTHDYPASYTSVATAQEAVKTAGLNILECEQFLFDQPGYLNGDGMFTILAQKPQ